MAHLMEHLKLSLSARRAWIEIPAGCWRDARRAVALRKESVDRNYKERPGQKARPKSLSARRAWIEIDTLTDDVSTGGVALRKESVDRNGLGICHYCDDFVALRKESVDRNGTLSTRTIGFSESLSARRAWIEMTQCRL